MFHCIDGSTNFVMRNNICIWKKFLHCTNFITMAQWILFCILRMRWENIMLAPCFLGMCLNSRNKFSVTRFSWRIKTTKCKCCLTHITLCEVFFAFNAADLLRFASVNLRGTNLTPPETNPSPAASSLSI